MEVWTRRGAVACAGLLTAVLWWWGANDGRFHWDEPGYLYTAAYLDTEEILDGEFQPSGNTGFSTARILHILVAHGLYAIFGVGPLVVGLLIGLYLALVVGSLGLALLVLQSLDEQETWVRTSIGLTMFAPVFLWLSFKTMPEAPALFFACASVLGLVRSLERPPALWLVIGAASLATMALFKATLAPMFASFVVTLLLLRGFGHPPQKVLVNASIIGVGSLVLFGVSLGLLGIPLEQYLASWAAVNAQNDPLVARLTFTLLEAGLLNLALPLALLASDRRPVYFMQIWYVLASLPFPVLLPHVEARFLLANLIPLLGLIALSLRGLQPHLVRMWRHPVGRVGLATTVASVVASGTLAQPFMAHEVESRSMQRVLADLDNRFGREEYSLVVPWLYADFHYLRVVYPELDVYTAFTSEQEALSPAWQRRHYGRRAVVSVDELQQLREPIIYLGFDETMPVANLRRLIGAIPIDGLSRWADERIARLSDASHFEASWMYGHPQVHFEATTRDSHYEWTKVTIRSD